MTFDEALAYRKKMKRVMPVDEQDFRHGWNAALVAMRDELGGEAVCDAVLALEVEVQT